MGLRMRENPGVAAGAAQLRKALADPVPCVQIAAAEALANFGAKSDFRPSLDVLIQNASPKNTNSIVAIAALNAIDSLGASAAVAANEISALPPKGNSPNGRFDGYAGRLLNDIQPNLKP
jgi:HEAT repeat protein